MPAIVSPKAAKKLLGQYGPYFEELDACLSAAEIEHGPQSATFLIQNTRYESSWRFSTDNSSIQAIYIQFRPVTLAGDEEWQDPLGTPDDTASPPSVEMSRPIGRNPESVPSSATPPSRLPASDPNIVEFFYATNRKESLYHPGYNPDGWTPVKGGYSGERNENLTFGAVSVRVPEGHHIGRIEFPLRVVSTRAVDSRTSYAIQFCDVLAGLTSRHFNLQLAGEDRDFMNGVVGAGLSELTFNGIRPATVFPDRIPPRRLQGPDIVDQMRDIMFGEHNPPRERE